MSYDTTIPTVSDILKWCPTLVVPNPFPIKNVLHYVDSKSTLATCSLVCRAWKEESQKALFSKVVISNDNTALADCLLTIAAPSDGFCLVQRVPPLTKLALHNTRFSLPEMANLLRWLPELEDFALVDPILTDRHQHNKFIYKDAFLFSLKILTVTATAHSESWPLTDYGLFLSRILPMFETIEHCNATYAEEDPSDLVIEALISGTPSDSSHKARNIKFVTRRLLLHHILTHIRHKELSVRVEDLYEVIRSDKVFYFPGDWKKLHVERYHLDIHRCEADRYLSASDFDAKISISPMLKLQELLFRVKECTIDLRPIQTFDSVITHVRGIIWLLRPSMELQVCLLLPELHKWPRELHFPSELAPHPLGVKLRIEFKIHRSQAGLTRALPKSIRNATEKYRNTNRRITVVPRPDTTAMEEYWSSRY